MDARIAECPPAVQVAHEQARDELRRADKKATTLLSLVGAALAGVVALAGPRVPVPALIALGLAALPVLCSVLLLLAAIRPRLTGEPRAGTWLHAAMHGPYPLLAEHGMGADEVAESLAVDASVLAVLAVRKYRRISRAVSLLVCGLCLLLGAVVLAVIA